MSSEPEAAKSSPVDAFNAERKLSAALQQLHGLLDSDPGEAGKVLRALYDEDDSPVSKVHRPELEKGVLIVVKDSFSLSDALKFLKGFVYDDGNADIESVDDKKKLPSLAAGAASYDLAEKALAGQAFALAHNFLKIGFDAHIEGDSHVLLECGIGIKLDMLEALSAASDDYAPLIQKLYAEIDSFSDVDELSESLENRMVDALRKYGPPLVTVDGFLAALALKPRP